MYGWEDAKFSETEGGLSSSFGETNVVYNPLKGISPYGWHFEQEVYLPEGIARAVKAGGGSGNIPKVILNECITSKKDKATKNKFLCGDNETFKPQLLTGFGEINFGKQYRQGNRVYSSEHIAMALNAQPVGNMGGYSYLYVVEEWDNICRWTR